MAFVYVLYSPSRQRTYVGCSENWQARLDVHNAGRVAATRSGIPWRLVHLEEVDGILQARRREVYLKTSAGRRWLKKTLGKLDETSGTSRPPTHRTAAPNADDSAIAPR